MIGQMYRKTLNFQMKINRNLGMYFVEVEGETAKVAMN